MAYERGNWAPDAMPRAEHREPSLLGTELASLLQAFELLQRVGDEWRSVWLANKIQEGIRRYGSPTGIRERRSYDPWESLRAV